MKKAQISLLRIYPIKSLGPVEVEAAEVGIHSLQMDRQFAIVDENGRYVNGKRTGRVNQLKTAFDLSNGLVAFADGSSPEEKQHFELREGNTALDSYLSNFFDLPVRLMQNKQGEFMDMPKASSLTVVSKASLESLQQDLDRHALESLRLRFRTNVELDGVDAYWEEKLYQEPGIGIRFKIGEVEMIGISPRARCNVPPQDPATGEMDYHFVKDMMESRSKHLTAESTLLQYGRKPYFLTINVYIPESEVGKTIRLGDEVELIEPVELR